MAATVNSRQLELDNSTVRSSITTVSITPSDIVFLKQLDSSVLPANIVLSTTVTNLTAPITYTWSWANSLAPNTWTVISGQASSSLTISSVVYETYLSTGTNVKFKVECSKPGFITSSATYTISYSKESDDVVQVLVSSPNILVYTDTSGTPISLNNTNTIITTILNGKNISYSLSGNETFNVGTPVISPLAGVALATPTISGNNYIYSNITSITDETVTVTFPVTVRNYYGTAKPVINVVQKYMKVKPGLTGNTAVFAYTIKSSATLPTAPSIVQSTVPTAGAPTVADNGIWYLQPKLVLATDEWMFQVSGTKSPAGAYTWETQGYLSTFKVGNLSAIAVNTGALTVNNSLTIGTNGTINSGIGYAGNGIFLGWDSTAYKLSIGSGTSKLTFNGSTLSVPTAVLTGTISTTQIADAAISAVKFASDIEPVSIVTSVPGTKSTNSIFNTTDKKLYRWNGTAYVATVLTSDLSGTISAAQIADGSVSGTKFASGLEPITIVTSVPATKSTSSIFNSTDGKLYRWNGTAYIASIPTTDLSGTITNAQIDALAAAKLTGTVVSSQIADAAITTAKFANGIEPIEVVSILPSTGNFAGRVAFLTTDNKLYRHTGTAWIASIATTDLSGTITNAQIDAIAAAKLTGQIVETQITNNSISTAKIAAGAISTAKLAAGAVTANEIAANTITAGNIAASTITGTQIAAGTITASNIATDTITAGQIAAGAISASEIAAGAITAGKIAAGAVTANEIAGNTITAGKIAVGAITANEIAANTITGAKIAAGTITAGNIAASTITGTQIAAGTITASNIATNTITAGQIAAGAISASELAAGAITAGKIAANTITANEIAANTITAGQIAADTITAGQIAAGAISASEIATGAVTATKISVTSLSSVSATIGTLRTVTTGSRVEISDNVIKIYEGAVLRVQLGNLAL